MIKRKVFSTHLSQVLLTRESEQLLYWSLLSLDVALFFIATKIAYFMRHDSWSTPHEYVALIIIGIFIFMSMLHVFGRYRMTHILSWFRQMSNVIFATVSTLGLLSLLLFFLKNGADISRFWMGYWGLITIFLTTMGHGALILYCHHQFKFGRHQRRILLVGNTEQMAEIKTHFEAHYMNVLGIHVTFGKMLKELQDLPHFKTTKTLIQQCIALNIDDVIVTARFGKSTEQEEQVLSILRQLPVAVRYCLPDVFVGKGVHLAGKWKGLPLVTLYRKPMLRHQLIFKRLLDIAGASAALLIFGLPMLIVGLIVKCTSKGPMFFVQERGGFGSASIPVIKFRSMTTMDAGFGKIKQATKNDVRITPIGRIIRKYSLDELPQILNVLKGNMSLVGPRPHALSHDDAYATLIDSYAARHRMKPGITGWAQVNGLRGETDTLDKMEARVAHDLYYIENWSIWLDLKILAMTPITFFQRNAY